MKDEDFIRRRSTILCLNDGTRILLRPVTPEDKPAFVDGFTQLSPRSRYRRFLSPTAELTPETLRWLTEVNYVDHFAWVALLADEPGRPGIGVARYVRFPESPDVAEAAVTEIDEYQSRGISTLLLRPLGSVALENRITHFRGYVATDNRPMLELARSEGAHLEWDSAGLFRMELDLLRRAEELRATPLYRLFRALARGRPRWIIRLSEMWARLSGRLQPNRE